MLVKQVTKLNIELTPAQAKVLSLVLSSVDADNIRSIVTDAYFSSTNHYIKQEAVTNAIISEGMYLTTQIQLNINKHIKELYGS